MGTDSNPSTQDKQDAEDYSEGEMPRTKRTARKDNLKVALWVVHTHICACPVCP